MRIIPATIGQKVKIIGLDAIVDTIFENKYIYCKFLNPTGRSGDGCATTSGITTCDGDIVMHPNYFKLQN